MTPRVNESPAVCKQPAAAAANPWANISSDFFSKISDELLQTFLAAAEHEVEESLKMLGNVVREIQRRIDVSSPRPTIRENLETRQDAEHASNTPHLTTT
jgi:hypothetical protein